MLAHLSVYYTLSNKKRVHVVTFLQELSAGSYFCIEIVKFNKSEFMSCIWTELPEQTL